MFVESAFAGVASRASAEFRLVMSTSGNEASLVIGLVILCAAGIIS